MGANPRPREYEAEALPTELYIYTNTYSTYLYYDTITINTLNFSLRTLFSSIQLLQSQYTLLTSTNYPVTTHLSQVTLYNPVTQQKVVT